MGHKNSKAVEWERLDVDWGGGAGETLELERSDAGTRKENLLVSACAMVVVAHDLDDCATSIAVVLCCVVLCVLCCVLCCVCCVVYALMVTLAALLGNEQMLLRTHTGSA